MKQFRCSLAVSLAGGLAFLTVPSLGAPRADYEGAGALFRQIQPAPAPSPQDDAAKGEQWARDWAEFRAKSAQLSPEEAAGQWLSLAERYFNLPAAAQRRSLLRKERTRNPLIAALPGPAAWPALAKMIAARPPQSGFREAGFEAGLHLLAATLVADPAAQRKAVNELSDIQGRPFAMMGGRIDLASLQDALAAQSDDPATVLADFEAKLALLRKGTEPAAGEFNVPDLVTILGGEEKAEPLLREAIMLPGGQLVISGAETKQLAAKTALSLADTMPSPHWELACSLDSAPLFEALQKRFPQPADASWKFEEARGYYLLHLIVTGQAAQAVQLAEAPQENPSSSSLPLDALEQGGYSRQVCDFLHELLAKEPGLPLWGDYIALAAKTGQTKEMLTLIRSMAGRADLPQGQHGGARESFYLALLAADQIDEGVAELRRVIADAEKGGAQGETVDPLEKEVGLARLGQLLDRPDLIEEGISAARKNLNAATSGDRSEDESVASLAELLVQLRRGPEAEEMLGGVLKILNATKGGGSSAMESALATLARVYYLAGRPKDVLAVLEKFPGWGASDLRDLLTTETQGYSLAEYSAHAAPDTFPVGYMAAWALAQEGEKAQALKIDNALLDREGGFDPGYELMLQLSGSGKALTRLRELFRRDQFEERPLIWKAQLQLDAGQLADAEQTIRAAIKIDPSDGEEGPGRRMRAYAVLADILEHKGDQDHARIYRGAVAAIRISERADRFYEAGLLARAVKMYEEALTHFADAYCIQSRLALRLSEMGDNAGAEEHYRRAYELMPESFGRVESHCFGCERAFAGHRAQGIAEKVFSRLAVTMPEKPQVHYLLGYLFKEEELYRQALPEFQEAVRLDPDYLNAWKQIGELGDEMHLSPKLRDAVALNEIRLDPLRRHASPSFENVTDLAALWKALAAANRQEQPAPGPLLPLAGSFTGPQGAGGMAGGDFSSTGGQDTDSTLQPVDAILANVFIDTAGAVLIARPGFSGRPIQPW